MFEWTVLNVLAWFVFPILAGMGWTLGVHIMQRILARP
jgi:hypothetical protein